MTLALESNGKMKKKPNKLIVLNSQPQELFNES